MDPKCIEFALSEGACNSVSPGLIVGYIFFGIALVVAIVLPLINALKNPGILVKSGISLGVLLVLFALSYVIADSNVSPVAKAFGESESSVRLISAGLIMFYITMFLAIAGVVYSEINKAFK